MHMCFCIDFVFRAVPVMVSSSLLCGIGCRMFVVVRVGVSRLFWSVGTADSSFTSE